MRQEAEADPRPLSGMNGSHASQPFSHAPRVLARLIIADAVPCSGNMQFARARLGSQDLGRLLRCDQSAAGGITCYQKQGAANGGQDLQGRAVAADRRGTGRQNGLIELVLRNGPLLYRDLGPASVFLAGGLALLQTLCPRRKQPAIALLYLLWRACQPLARQK